VGLGTPFIRTFLNFYTYDGIYFPSPSFLPSKSTSDATSNQGPATRQISAQFERAFGSLLRLNHHRGGGIANPSVRRPALQVIRGAVSLHDFKEFRRPRNTCCLTV
jgi:hypothetical protein